MKKFEMPELEIVALETDIITTSTTDEVVESQPDNMTKLG